MKKREEISTYPAKFDPAEEGGYNVSFPDFPGCVTFGRTFEEAKKMGTEVLSLWIEELRVHQERIPTHLGHPIVDEVAVSLS